MGLAPYRRKRRFGTTPEPRGRSARGRGGLRFVVQKYAARRLHYDFRLELDGVQKSWAVPKGPSLDTSVKRLAVQVEDHPLEYGTFEGVIPAGNYGAGEVTVWDRGTYRAAGAGGRADSERLLRAGLERGRLNVVLSGTKLRGGFALVRAGRGGRDWLLLKRHDEHAGGPDPTADGRSAVTGRRIEDVAAGRRRRPRKIAVAGAKPAPMPRGLRPMLATPAEGPFDREGWVFEVKWDGYRAVAEVEAGKVRLYSRTGQPFERRFARVVEALRGLGHDAVLDGEVVALDAEGRSQFRLLQNYIKSGVGRIAYVVFDLLYLDGRDLRGLPLVRRKAALARVVKGLKGLILSEHVEEQGVAFFRAAAARGLEGVIGKDGSSPYRVGVRSREWLKVKSRRRQEAVIAGFTEPRGGREHFGALVLGVYEAGGLAYVGHTGGGFDRRRLAELRERLRPLERRRCPFRVVPATNAPVRWVRPELVCEVEFREWTRDGLMRQPIFLGLREDKPAASVRRELPPPAGAELPPPEPEPALTNLAKIYWPGEGTTKGDLIDYYRAVAPVMLPYLRDRPQSLHRHPNGIEGASFFQKDVGKHPPPDWVTTALVPGDEGAKRYLLCQDEATLLYMANLGCIEVNPFNARVDALDRPDYLVIDLDPQGVPFVRVVEAALAVRRLLDRAGAQSVCKTSGKRGLHVYVPLGARYPTEVARQFAELVASLVHAGLPETTSVVRQPALRRGRVYLDYLQNRRGQTLVAPYSVRPAPGATISTPLRWSEVRRGLDPAKFTMRTVPRRLDRLGDLWAPVLGAGTDLAPCVERLRASGPRAGR